MTKLTASKARIIYFVLAVTLFVLGSGAPLAGGGVIENAVLKLFGF
ncbi:MAG: hypothetical protein ACYC6H_09365 [Bellilinea sp.]|jgi:hypothetical protein